MNVRFASLVGGLLAGVTVSLAVSCGGSNKSGPAPAAGSDEALFAYKAQAPGEAAPVPRWMQDGQTASDKLCGYGVAGAGYNEFSPYPREMSEARAIRNIAGVLGTRVQEAIIDTMRTHTQSVEEAHALTVDDELIEKVKALAKTEFWLDVNGEGPYGAKGFTYAFSCVDAKSAGGSFHVDAKKLAGVSEPSLLRPEQLPDWIDDYGAQKDGRLCAVGFSLPTFHPDKTFENVIEDVRWQLAEVLQTYVSSYYEEHATERAAAYEAMTLATTEAVSKGVIVTHYWYDKGGIGPVKKTRSTYGFGCVYPVPILTASASLVEKDAPEDEQKVIARVRERAKTAFDALDAEIEKRGPGASSGAARP